MRAKTVIAVVSAALMLGACGLWGRDRHADDFAAAPEPEAAPQVELPAFAFAPLSADALRAHIERLSSDQFGGRAPGSEGEALTIDYISRAFSEAGLQPAVRDATGRQSWLQPVPLVSATVTNNPTLTITSAQGEHAYAYGADFVAWTKHEEPSTVLENAELVFVGYGVVSTELGWNDYAGLDMHGKIAVILINDPDFETGDDRGFRGRAMTYYGRWTYKFEEAARQGAAGALLIHQTAPAAYPWGVVQSSWTGPQHDIVRDDGGASRVAVEGWIQEGVARTLFQNAGLDLDHEKARAQRPDFTPVSLGQTASIALETHIEREISHNVAGLLPGRVHPDEVVVYTAHWDHLGHCPPIDGDGICNGALDNASGVASLIELARRFVNGGRLQRSVLFLSVTAEESGLLGSYYYTEHPIFPAAKTAAEINMDGINIFGPTHDVTVIGAGQNDLETLLAAAAAQQNRVISPEAFPERGGYFRSDHFNFARVGVPALNASSGLDLFDGGVERGRALQNDYVANRYHKPSDEFSPDWDLSGAMRDLMLLEDVGHQVADSALWPQWRPGSEFAAARAASRAQH